SPRAPRRAEPGPFLGLDLAPGHRPRPLLRGAARRLRPAGEADPASHAGLAPLLAAGLFQRDAQRDPQLRLRLRDRLPRALLSDPGTGPEDGPGRRAPHRAAARDDDLGSPFRDALPPHRAAGPIHGGDGSARL